LKVADITVVIPSQDRPERLLRAVESVLSTAPDAEVVCVLDRDDDASRAILRGLDVRSVLISGGVSTAERWNAGAIVASGDLFVTGADDLIFQPGWAEAALVDMQKLNNYGIVALNLGPDFNFGLLASHFMASRKYCSLGQGGVLMPPVYQHGFCDVEVTYRATQSHRIIHCEAARAVHEHPHNGTAEEDDIYRKGKASHDEDDALFHQRKQACFPNDWEPVIDWKSDGWGTVAIALRSYKYPEAGFLDSWTYFLLGGLRNGDVVMPAARGPHHIAANQLAHTFLSQSGCDSILFIDDDMAFDSNALSILRDNVDNWEYDVVQGFCTFRTEPPHAVVYLLAEEQPSLPESLGGEVYNALAHIPDNDVVDVDAVGMAFTLVKRHVFENMIGEHGSGWTVWFDWGLHSEGEDIRFSRRCRENGYSLAVDTHCKIEHIGHRAYGWREHQQLVKQLENNYG
jgi:glycosyltransferase involved in cell wall biosynthesis